MHPQVNQRCSILGADVMPVVVAAVVVVIGNHYKEVVAVVVGVAHV